MRIAIKSTLIRSTILATAFGFAIGLAGAQAETIITDDIFPFPSEWTDNDNNFADDDPPRGVNISGTSGSLRVDGGNNLTAVNLTSAFSESDINTIVFDGVGTTVDLVGTTVHRVLFGFRGSTNMTVSGGAIVDAAMDTCAVVDRCGTFLGSFTGGNASLTVTGTGSRYDGIKFFSVGRAMVWTLEVEGVDAGIPGGTATGTLDVLAGGVLNTEAGSIAVNFGGSGAIGTEQVIVTATVDGEDSQWNI